MSKKKQKRTPTPLKPVSLDERLETLTGPILDADGNEVAAVIADEDVIDYDVKLPAADKPEELTKNLGAVPDDATPDNCPLTPSPGHVVIVRESPKHIRSGKVIVPKDTRERDRTMMAEVRVMAVGEGTFYACGEPWPAPCAPGDRMLTRGVNAFSTHKRKGSDTVWEVLPFDALVAKVDMDSDVEPPMMRVVGDGVQ